MNVKTDTKEKFVVFSPQEAKISANMAEMLAEILLSNAEKDPPHIILNLEAVKDISPEAALKLAEVSAFYMEKRLSMVICCLGAQPAALVKELDLEDILNITPTESEAWDILQMEEIERELLGGFDLED
jgi:anti-anti-sigma regulatory factor